MVGGGDQIYCDAITREKELQGKLVACRWASDTDIRLDQRPGPGVEDQPPVDRRNSRS